MKVSRLYSNAKASQVFWDSELIGFRKLKVYISTEITQAAVFTNQDISILMDNRLNPAPHDNGPLWKDMKSRNARVKRTLVSINIEFVKALFKVTIRLSPVSRGDIAVRYPRAIHNLRFQNELPFHLVWMLICYALDTCRGKSRSTQEDIQLNAS
jgi:hypothetical protein